MLVVCATQLGLFALSKTCETLQNLMNFNLHKLLIAYRDPQAVNNKNLNHDRVRFNIGQSLVFLTMSTVRHMLYAFVAFFLAITGFSVFYYDLRTGKFRKSRFLKFYSILPNVMFSFVVSWIIYDDFQEKGEIFSSNYKIFIKLTRCLEFVTIFLTCMYSCHFKQYRMAKLYDRMTKLQESWGIHYKMSSRCERIFLYTNLLLIFVNNSLPQFLNKRTDAFLSLLNYLTFITKLCLNLTTAVTYMIAFYIIWTILQCSVQVQKCLDRLHHTLMHYKELHRLHRILQKLIELTAESSQIFNHNLVLIHVRCAWHFILSGYFTIRAYNEDNAHFNALRDHIMVLLMWTMSFLVLLGLDSFGGKIKGILGETLYKLRRSCPQNELIERKVSSLL